jgi:hypothetical protein
MGQQFQNQGIGKKLLIQVEGEVRKLGGKLLIIETAGKPIFEPTHQFNLRAGCNLEVRIRDFYKYWGRFGNLHQTFIRGINIYGCKCAKIRSFFVFHDEQVKYV